MNFDGAVYDGPDLQEHDHVRLRPQTQRVFDLMKDGQWRSLDEIATAASAPHASASAQLRHLRKARFGGHSVSRRHLGGGLYLYRLEVRAED